MGQGTPGGLNRLGEERKNEGEKKEKKFEPAAPPARVGRKQRKQKGPEAAARIPAVTPVTKCKVRLLKLERIKDYLLMEEEFVANQERLKPQEEKTEEDRSKVDDLRGSPMSVGNLEELIDENHAIVSSSVGPEYYVAILSFVDKDQLEPGCSILMHNKVLSVVGLLQDEVDPMVSVMKVEKAPLESYADIGGLDAQKQEMAMKKQVEGATTVKLYQLFGRSMRKSLLHIKEVRLKRKIDKKIYLQKHDGVSHPESTSLKATLVAYTTLAKKCDDVKPAERMLGNIIELEMDYIYSSQSNLVKPPRNNKVQIHTKCSAAAEILLSLELDH